MASNNDGKKNNGSDSKSSGGGGILGKQFQKMRRRLTVTGASSTIDGSVKPGVDPVGDVKKNKVSKDQQQRSKIQSVITEFHGISKKGHAPYNPRKKKPRLLDYEGRA